MKSETSQYKRQHNSLYWQVPLLIVASLLYFTLTHGAEYFNGRGASSDYDAYSAMVDNSFTDTSIPSPWNRRILMPLLAQGFNIATKNTPYSFLLINILALAISIPLLWKFCEKIGLTAQKSHDCCLLFLLSVGFHSIRYYGVPDALVTSLILASLLSGLSNKPYITAITLSTAILAKDGCILLLPCTALLLWRNDNLIRTKIGTVCVCLAACTTFITLRTLIPATNNHSYFSDTNISMLLSYWHFNSPSRFFQWVIYSLCYSLGPIWGLAALALPSQWRFAIKTSAYWVPFFVPILLATDTSRMLTTLFPVFLPIAVSILPPNCRITTRITIICTGLLAITFFWTAPAKNIVAPLLVALPVAMIVIQRVLHREKLTYKTTTLHVSENIQ